MAYTLREVNHLGVPSMHLKSEHDVDVNMFPRLKKFTNDVFTLDLTGVEIESVSSSSGSVSLVMDGVT